MRQRRFPPLRRAVKILAALILLAAGGLAELGSLVRTQSTDAIVSAPRLAVRSPIDGVIATAAPALGSVVHRGDVLVRVHDPRVSRLPLADLRSRAAHLRAELAAAAQRRGGLLALQADLKQRADLHTRLLGARLDAEIAGADAALMAAVARQEQSRRDVGRSRALTAGGDVAPADLERTQTNFAAALQTGAMQDAQRRSLQAQRDATAVGIYAEPGANDASYAAQRLDEITLRLGDLDQSVAILTAELAQSDALTAATVADLAQRGEAEIVASADAMVWRTGARDGDFVAAGEPVADLVVCDQAVVVAAVRQRDLATIPIGAIATVRLSGETQDRQGRVLSTLAEGAVAGDARLAALPATEKVPGAVVLVGLEPAAAPAASDHPESAATACPVGRTARVLLPRGDTSTLRALLDRVL